MGGGGGVGGLRLTLDEQDHPLERAITIMSLSYLGNTTVEERYEQHSYMLPRLPVILVH